MNRFVNNVNNLNSLIKNLATFRKRKIPLVWEQLVDQKNPVRMNSYELGFMTSLIADHRHKVPEVWKQLVDQKDPVRMNSYELGFMTSLIADHRHEVPEVWRQLMDMLNKFREDGGVKMTELENGMVKLKDKDGTIIIREKYEWEK